jgi:hypothetical protein
VADKARARERRAAAAATLARRLRLRWDIEGHRASYGDVPLEEVLTSALLDDAAAALLPPPTAAVTLRPAAAAAAEGRGPHPPSHLLGSRVCAHTCADGCSDV